MRRSRALLLATSIALIPACAARGADPEVFAKERGAVPEVASITRDSLRYEAVPWGRTRGLAQNGGYIAVIDARTGQELQLVKVYGPESADDREDDKRDVFISAITIGTDGRLRVEDERGRIYWIDRHTLTIVPP